LLPFQEADEKGEMISLGWIRMTSVREGFNDLSNAGIKIAAPVIVKN